MNTDREDLQFAETVTQVFAFLQEYGFHQVEALPTLVRYRCGDLEARVFHGRRSHELGFEIGHGEDMFRMWDLIRFSDSSAAEHYFMPVVRTPSALISRLQELAAFVRCYGERALRNDPTFYEDLRQQREAWMKQYWFDMRCRQVRPKAEVAFRERRYQEAAKLYGEIEAGLSPAELKKLAIARKRS
ncbi:MAG: hypothetical protein AB7G75_23640 [Candidatus Binatia bacterium]